MLRIKYSVQILGLFLLIIGISGCGTETSESSSEAEKNGTITPTLIFQTQEGNEAYTIPAARDITVDIGENLYIFDYAEYFLKKYDSSGKHLLTFGKMGTNPGEFTHLTGIKAVGDQLLAVDSVGLLTFSQDGQFLVKQAFPQEVLTDHPAIFNDGSFVGQQIVSNELKTILSYRSPGGKELDRLAFYDLQEFFPEIKIGDDFFLNNVYARSYCYAFNRQGDILWTASDNFKIYQFSQGKSHLVLTGDYTPVLFPEDRKEALQAQKDKLKPPLFMYVPDKYQLIHHLLVGPDGDIWIYIKSQEKTGFLHYTAQGMLKGFYTVIADFDATNAIVRIFHKQMYFLITERGAAQVYKSELPI